MVLKWCRLGKPKNPLAPRDGRGNQPPVLGPLRRSPGVDTRAGCRRQAANEDTRGTQVMAHVEVDISQPQSTRSETVEVSIVMPCLNEADTLATCIEKAQRALRHANINGEIIIDDNGST